MYEVYCPGNLAVVGQYIFSNCTSPVFLQEIPVAAKSFQLPGRALLVVKFLHFSGLRAKAHQAIFLGIRLHAEESRRVYFFISYFSDRNQFLYYE